MSFLETLVCLLVAMVVLGPKRLPGAARKLGRWMGMFRRASEEFKRQIMMMDQTVTETVNRATTDLDALVPTDEEVNSALDFSTELPPDTPLPYPYSDPPPASPDDAWDTEPVSGGLPVDEPTAPVSQPNPTQSNPESKPSVHRPYGKVKVEPPKPRSLGLSPTPPAKEVTHG